MTNTAETRAPTATLFYSVIGYGYRYTSRVGQVQFGPVETRHWIVCTLFDAAQAIDLAQHLMIQADHLERGFEAPIRERRYVNHSSDDSPRQRALDQLIDINLADLLRKQISAQPVDYHVVSSSDDLTVRQQLIWQRTNGLSVGAELFPQTVRE